MSDSDEDSTLHRYLEVPPRTMYTGREMSPMSVQSFSHSSRMQYPPLYAQNARELMYNKRCQSPMSVRSYGQWGYNNRCLSTMSVRSNDSNVSALDIQFALNDIRKYNKHDLKIIKSSIYNAYKQIKNYDRWRIAKRKKLKSYFTKYRRTSDSADDDNDDKRNGESGADGSDSSISDDCRSTRSAFNARHIPRSRARRHNGVGAMKMDLNIMTEQVRDSENYRDCTANIKQRTLRNSLSHNRTLDHSLAPRHNQQKITHDIIENGPVSMKDHFDNRNAQLSETAPISMNNRFVKDSSTHLPHQKFNKNIFNQQNLTHDSRNTQLSETQNDKFQDGSISLKDRFAKDNSMLLPCQRFNNKNVTYKVSYTQKQTTAHQEQSVNINTNDEDIFPQAGCTQSTANLKGSDTSSLQQKRVQGNNRNGDSEDEQIFSQSNPTQFNTNTSNQKRILDNHDSPDTKRAKLLNLPENKIKNPIPKRGVMKKLTTNNNGFKKPSGINKKTVLSGLDQFWKTDLESEEDCPVISSSVKCLQKDQQKNRENNKDDFTFKKPQAPISKLGTVMRHNQSDVLIAKSSQPLIGNVEPTFNQVKQNPRSATNHEKKETTEQIIHKQPNQSHSDTVISNTMVDSTHNSTDVSMRPSFIKRKLFTQTLDIAQDTNISSDNMNSPQTKTLRTCREKNKVRKLTSQSCLSRDITSDSNYMDLIHKIVPPEQLKNQTVNNSKVNKKKTSKNVQEKPGKWDVSLALSTCDDEPKSDTYTDEEIFNMPQEENKEKPIKKITDKGQKEDASQSHQSESNCKVVIQKLPLLDTKRKETSPKRGVRKKVITNNNDVNFKKPTGLTKKSALSALGTFWDTDFTDEEDSMIYSARTTQRAQQENKENEHESPNKCIVSTHNRSPNKVLKNNNRDPKEVTKNQNDNKGTKKNNKTEMPKAANAKSKKNNSQSQSTLNTSRESLRLKEKKQSREARVPDKNHTESPSDKCNTSRQSLRIKQKKLANSFTVGTSSHIDNKLTKKNSKQIDHKPKTLSQSTFNISRESLRKSCLTDKNHNIESVSNKRGKVADTPIRMAKLNCIVNIRTNKVK